MIYDLHDQPALTDPVLIVVLEGWIDAGYAAATAAQVLLDGVDSYPVATFDSDALLDHRARRPIMHLVDGVNTGLSWPSLELRAGIDAEGNDLLLLLGSEPDHAWKAFSDAALDLAQGFGTRLVVGLGAYPATVPHTRPVALSVTAANEELAAVSGLLRGTLDVPAGVQAVIERRADEAGIPALGLWAQVPHYVSGDPTPYHAGSLALLHQLERTAGLSLPTGTLTSDATDTRRRLDEAVASNPEHLAMLHALEARHDEMIAEGATAEGPLPSADELAAEVEQFLRDQGPDA
ncbi:MAG: PAC2 family protein [Acidimicrobiales bacterium]|nr:PAC2 family protein [Acidimicrobiales bacterium]